MTAERGAAPEPAVVPSGERQMCPTHEGQT
jgi:hypothetical protein